MGTPHKIKLFRSVLGCGCNLDSGEFSQEAQFDDVEKWLRERGYELTRVDLALPEPHLDRDTAVTR
jgi:EAL domain-containing protein (putative c-di-GMP-specific phosphodiesterase class I)